MVQEEAAAIADEVVPAIRGVVDPTRIEPQLLAPVELEPEPDGPVRVRVARLELPPGGGYRPPARTCQDVLLLVREGELRAVGTGIAPPEAPATIYAGDAVRFGPEGDGLLTNLADQPARTVVAFVRAEDGAPCDEPAAGDPLVAANRLASLRTTPVLALHGGALRARVLLDADGAGARHGGLAVIDGDPGLRLPAHRHAGAAEILFVERGTGVLRIEDRAIRARPGAALYVPAGALHSYEAEGDDGLVAIQVYTPSGPERGEGGS